MLGSRSFLLRQYFGVVEILLRRCFGHWGRRKDLADVAILLLFAEVLNIVTIRSNVDFGVSSLCLVVDHSRSGTTLMLLGFTSGVVAVTGCSVDRFDVAMLRLTADLPGVASVWAPREFCCFSDVLPSLQFSSLSVPALYCLGCGLLLLLAESFLP